MIIFIAANLLFSTSIILYLPHFNPFAETHFTTGIMKRISFILEPDAPPQNFTGHNISQTEIQVFWAPVPQDKVNGILIRYVVFYKRAPGKHPFHYKIFNGSHLQGIIDGLQPFTGYDLTVNAYTIKGPGPFSSYITVKTEEEGMSTFRIWHVNVK